MGIFSFLPKVERCCWCTRNLKVASILIVVWSMCAAALTINLVMHPTCVGQYHRSSGPMYLALTIFQWILHILSLAVIGSSFAFMVGILMSIPQTADIFMVLGSATAVCSILFAILCFTQLFFALCPFNVNDPFWLLLTSVLWFYFIIVVSSYRESIGSS